MGIWSVALRAIPWTMILANAPAIVRGAESLLSTARAPRAGRPSSDELERLANRITALERHDHANAELLKQMAMQIETLSTATEVLAARLRWSLAIGLVSAALAILALGMLIASR